MATDIESVPTAAPHPGVVDEPWTGMSRMLNIRLENALDVARLNREGVAPELLDVLLDRGLTRRELDWIVPVRTLSHRRRNGERLKANETGGFLRAVKIQAMAETVLGSRRNALSWLRKNRRALGGNSAMELMRTEAGGQLVEEQLIRLDEGYFA